MVGDNIPDPHPANCIGCGLYHGSENVLIACIQRALVSARGEIRTLKAIIEAYKEPARQSALLKKTPGGLFESRNLAKR
jgi:hypothetical protein